MYVEIIALGEYRWGEDPNFLRTSQYTGTGDFIVPAPVPPTSVKKMGVGALWGGSGVDEKIGYDKYKVIINNLTIYIDYRTDNMDFSSLGDLFIFKEQNGTYKWHNDGTGFQKEGEAIVNGTEYNAWGDLWNISLQTDDFDTDIYVPANFYLELYPLGAPGYGVPKLSWDNNGNDEFVIYELERSLTGQFGGEQTVIYEIGETGGATSYSYIDYEIRIHPTQNPETAYYRVKTMLKSQLPSDDLIGEIRNFTNILSTDYFIMLKLIKREDIASNFLNTPEYFTLLPNYPNPFSGFTHIPFYVPEDGKVTLTIFDLLGRSIRLLHAGKLYSGEYLSGWDGKNARGYPVPSGTYFVILHGEQQRSVRKLNFIK